MVTIAELEIADEPERWSALGFAVEDDRCRIGAVDLRFAGREAGRGLVRWQLRELLAHDGDPGAEPDLDGLPTARAAASEPPSPAPAHPNGISAIDHVVAISPDLDRTTATLRRAGLDLRRIREQPTPAGAPRQAFFRLGAEILEVVQEPQEIAARAGGRDRSAFFWGIALRCADLDATVAGLGDHVSEIRDAVQPGRRIASVRRVAGLALPVALMTD
jgi:catechol 2,3-dioxygenase-like lactoylglutathione lyase family enzyme